jgi:GTP cyclohydrolase III
MFIAIDGDDVGSEIERMIVLCQSEALTSFWKNVTLTIVHLEKRLLSQGAKILLCGGDSILAELQGTLAPKAMYELFSDTSPLSFSVGTGHTMLEAYIALKTAKASGKRCWIDYSDLSSILRLQYDSHSHEGNTI